jgi:hypothetical protein
MQTTDAQLKVCLQALRDTDEGRKEAALVIRQKKKQKAKVSTAKVS